MPSTPRRDSGFVWTHIGLIVSSGPSFILDTLFLLRPLLPGRCLDYVFEFKYPCGVQSPASNQNSLLQPGHEEDDDDDDGGKVPSFKLIFPGLMMVTN